MLNIILRLFSNCHILLLLLSKVRFLWTFFICRAMIKRHRDVGVFPTMSKVPEEQTKALVCFYIEKSNGKREPMNKQVIEYMEESLENMKKLIDQIRSKDTLLTELT